MENGILLGNLGVEEMRVQAQRIRGPHSQNITEPPTVKSGGSGESSAQQPAANIALTIVVESHGDYCAIVLKPCSVILACSDIDNA